MGDFTLFHFYLIFFLLGLGYAVVAVVMGQLMGGGETAEAGTAEAAGGDVDFDVGDVDIGDVDVGDVDVAEAGDFDAGADAEAAEAGADAGGEAGGADVDVGEAMPGISPLSPVTIATFATSFGGVGVILDKAMLPGWVSVPIAGGSGFVVAAGVFYLFYRVFSMTQSTSSVATRHTVGRQAKVITAIPADGTGEVAYVLGGRRFNAPARAADGEPLPGGTAVVIQRMEAGVCYVRKSAVERLEQ